MKLKIMHLSEYSYGNFITGSDNEMHLEPTLIDNSINEVRLKPRTNYRQHLAYYDFSTAPAVPVRWHKDYFQSDIACFEVIEPHNQLSIIATSVVLTAEGEPRSGYVLKPEDERALLNSAQFQNRYAEYLHMTPRTLITQSVADYFKTLYSQCSTGCIYDYVRSLTTQIHKTFQYQPGVTNIHTTVDDTVRLKGGVCQDFAHLMLATCRDIGIPARYVSGYQYIGDLPENIGNDNLIIAMHAWIEAFIPGAGWLGFDPTNDNIMSWRYVKIADGRDYNDIIPIKGLYRGNAIQTLSVKVKIDKLD
ncbi:MAG: transglutaminase family protein [Bacillota bacterium]